MLGKKQFSLTKGLTDVRPGEEIFTILHTQEQFRSKDEYEKRLDLYNQEIWTCQCTGHTTLTHEEAWKSEKQAFKTLKSQFPECFEKPVLQIVHHSTDSLDVLNDQAWMKIHQILAVGETVTFKVNSCSKTLKGTIVGISPAEVSTSSNCNSPSSDKENSSEEKEKSPKKWTPPKLLPYKYSVQLEDGPIINSVPVQDLSRIERPPSKDLVRLFIRSFAVRSGNYSTSPWVVSDDLVKKYALPSKFADFLISPTKMAEAAKRAEEVGKKRKRQSQDGVTSKKLKLSDSSEKKKKVKDKADKKLMPVSLNKKVKSPSKTPQTSDSDRQKKAKKGDTPLKKKSPKKKQDVIEIGDSSDDEVSLARIKQKCEGQADDSDSDVPLSSIADQHTPKKKKLSLSSKGLSPDKKKKTPGTPKSKKTSDSVSSGTPKSKKSPSKEKKTPTKRKRHESSDSDVPLSKLTTPGTPKSQKSSPNKSFKEKNEQTPKKKAKSLEKEAEKKKRGRPRKGDEKSPKKPGPKKGMKQMTLLDLAKKDGKSTSKSPVRTPKKSPQKPPPTPLIVKKLLQLNKAEDKVKFSMLLKKAVATLTPTQKKNLPSPLKEKVQKKMELMEEKKALEKMSESEREEYLKQKKEKQKLKMKEKMYAKLKEMRQRYEDQDLDLKPLPAPKLVSTPDNLPNELFGDVAMVTEFISSYSGLLMPESEYPIYADALMKALAGGANGFAYLSRVLGTLLQTLLQDEIAEGYQELCVKLSDVAVNPYTVSELLRLCLRSNDADDNGSDEGDPEESEVPDPLVQQLETQEFFQLECQEKLSLLRGLCLRLMATYSVQDYMEEKQREAVQLTKQRNTEMKGYNEKQKEKKQQKGEEKPSSANVSVNGDVSSQDSSPAMTITSFYGKKPEDSSANDSAADSQGEDGDLVSIVKRRRLLAARAAAEKEKKDLQRKLLREKEYQEERERRERELFETKFKDSILLARTVLRHSPIGSDRHHNRYWMFTNTTPGLYIEKGWVTQDILYNPGGVPDESGDATTSTASSTPAASPTKTPGTPRRLNLKKKKALVESTVPHYGQNLWFTYTSLKDLDLLLSCLHPQGIRESALKAELKKRYVDITRAIQAAQRNNLELRDSDGQVEMAAGFKKELADIELRLRNGGLGGVPNYTTWEAKLMSAEDIPTMAACMLETLDNVMDKFLQGFMKPPRKTDEGDAKEEDEHHDRDDADEEAVGEEEESTKEEKKLSAAERRVQQWKEAVENCPTMSRLHVLLSMVDSCIKWEKSAENAKCKICRKKGDDERLLLCDECNQAFHMYCLRPPLINVPRGDWFCPACVPQSKRRSQAPRRLADESESEAESEEEPEERSTTCEECGGEAGEEETEQLVVCHKCPSVYHLLCHQPPLRRMPRGSWECNNCKNGITRHSKKRPQRKASSRKNYRDEDDSTEEDSEPTPRHSSRSSSARRSGRTSTGETSTSRSTRSSGDRFEDLSQHRSRRAPSDLSICEDILQRLMKMPCCWPFLEPVDKKEVPDYYQIIKKPMDFQTMLKKCGRLSYSSPQEFVDDAILVFSNAATYNQPSSEVFRCMREAEKVFGELLTKYLPSYAVTQLLVQDGGDVSNNARTRRTRSK